LFASCASSAPRVVGELSPNSGGVLSAPAPVQEAVEDVGSARSGYITLGGGLTFQGVDTGTGGGSATIDTTSLNGNLGFGFYLTNWLDIGASDNVFWTESKVPGQPKSTTLANNINAFANFNLLGFNDDVAAYIGPNVGVYLSESESGGTSISSEAVSYGGQIGLRIFLSRRAAFKAELRTIFSEIENPGSTTVDVDQTSLLFGVDFTF